MGAKKKNRKRMVQQCEFIEAHLEAIRVRDESRYAAAYAEDAVVRMAGVPRALGGVLEGRESIVNDFRDEVPQSFEVRLMFADDTHVCVVAKRSSALKETQFFRGNDRRFTTYQCIVYRIDGGRIQEQVSYANWMDVYVQTGVVDLATLIA